MLKEDLVEFADFATSIGNTMGKALEDNKLSMGDLTLLITDGPGLAGKAVKAFEGMDNIKIADLEDPENLAELVTYVKEHLDIPQDVTEERIEKLVKAVAGIVEFAFSLKPTV